MAEDREDGITRRDVLTSVFTGVGISTAAYSLGYFIPPRTTEEVPKTEDEIRALARQAVVVRAAGRPLSDEERDTIYREELQKLVKEPPTRVRNLEPSEIMACRNEQGLRTGLAAAALQVGLSSRTIRRGIRHLTGMDSPPEEDLPAR